MPTPQIFIFDFDSTFIQVETFDILAQVALENHPQKKERVAMIEQITRETMEGRFPYQDSLKNRFPLLELNKSHIEQAIEILKHKITPSFLRNADFFKKYANHIYVISGAFIEILWPVLQSFGLHRHQVFGNRLLYDFEGKIHGFDQFYPLAQDQGKVKLVQQLHLTGDIVMIGDGYNDYELKESGLVNLFVGFTENVERQAVVKVADAVINSLEGLFITCGIPYTGATAHKKVLLLENIHPSVTSFFQHQGYCVEHFTNALDEETLISKLSDVHLLGIRSKSELTATVLNAAQQLQAIGAFCIGTNQIDLSFCSQQGIAVFNAPFSNTRSVVELVMAEIIMLTRKAAQMSHQLSQGVWHKSSVGAHEVRGKILGIIGYGNIGSQLSILAEAMGMQVIYYDIDIKLPLGNAKVCQSMTELLSHADVVSVHVDGRKENKHLIGNKEFEQMKAGVIFLNLSRDFVVDYAALIEKIQQKHIGGIGIDVFPKEPHESKGEYKTPLQEFENAILTPHIGGSTEEAQQHIGDYVSKNLLAYFQEGSSIGSVNFPQLSLPSMNYPQRIIHIHKNVPGILARINQLFAQSGTNVEGQFLKTNDHIGYVITDINRELESGLLEQLQQIPNTIKVRILNKV